MEVVDIGDLNAGLVEAKDCEKAYRLAYEYDQKYGACPQCVIAAVQETIGGISDDVFKASQALSGGGGLAGKGTCGALAGGMMAISAYFGREKNDFAKKNRKPYELAKKLYDRFTEKYGGPSCHDVQRTLFGRTFNMWSAEEFRQYLDSGGHNDKCPAVSGDVAKWTVEIILGEKERVCNVQPHS